MQWKYKGYKSGMSPHTDISYKSSCIIWIRHDKNFPLFPARCYCPRVCLWHKYISYFYLHHTLSLTLALLCTILSFTRWKTFLKIEIQDPHPWNSFLHELESLFIKMEVLNVYSVSHTKTWPLPHNNINKISFKLCGNITQKLMKKISKMYNTESW